LCPDRRRRNDLPPERLLFLLFPGTRMPHHTMTLSHPRSARRIIAAGAVALALALGGCAGKHKIKTTPTVGNRVPILS
ncbi:hypothetical protein, partial [Enterococcus faecalis]|uniref:hypothetical protein n=1 Tax=Enterococcus faecalis TaxID=1351 RepID=UPI00403FB8C3